ncbi:hypothetical protein [Paraburkholderia bannensis]|uniref:hypothetical protein n=1 Tax=Paraburkholderia bannensis TaxID=765414 RepID=UPI0012EC95C1|nr:hypothetical protein [Paraburkholderia bannensis]
MRIDYDVGSRVFERRYTGRFSHVRQASFRRREQHTKPHKAKAKLKASWNCIVVPIPVPGVFNPHAEAREEPIFRRDFLRSCMFPALTQLDGTAAERVDLSQLLQTD